MHGYFNDIHIINADRIPNCLIELRSFSYSDRASLGLLHSGDVRSVKMKERNSIRKDWMRAAVIIWMS